MQLLESVKQLDFPVICYCGVACSYLCLIGFYWICVEEQLTYIDCEA